MTDDRERIIAAIKDGIENQIDDEFSPLWAIDDGSPSADDQLQVEGDIDIAALADILLSVVNDLRAEAWDECCKAVGWALDKGPSEMAVQYVRGLSPYWLYDDKRGKRA